MTNMNKKYQTAFDQLKKLGVPVIEGGWNGEDTFRISGEDNYPIIWADYYSEGHGTTLDDFGVNHEINDTLEANGLYAGWYNSGVLGVFTS
tara:strand:- start:336 stop:608 length:273 start_codon:yes stop_codon:yes gene_type:complete